MLRNVTKRSDIIGILMDCFQMVIFCSSLRCAGTTVVAANPAVVSPTPVPVQIITSSGQVVSQAMAVQSAPQPQQTVVQTVAPQQKPKTHFCSSCGKGFAAKHGLLQHNRRHTNGSCTLRTHVCECGKAFFQKNHLMLHQRQHLETKPNISQQVSEHKP